MQNTPLSAPLNPGAARPARDVFLREVGLRDGLQIHSTFMPTEQKLGWIRAEAAAGMPELEVTSYVPARVIPQFADAEAVYSYEGSHDMQMLIVGRAITGHSAFI